MLSFSVADSSFSFTVEFDAHMSGQLVAPALTVGLVYHFPRSCGRIQVRKNCLGTDIPSDYKSTSGTTRSTNMLELVDDVGKVHSTKSE